MTPGSLIGESVPAMKIDEGVVPAVVLTPALVMRMREHVVSLCPDALDVRAIMLNQAIENARAYQNAMLNASAVAEEARFAAMFDRAHRTIHTLYQSLCAPPSGGGASPTEPDSALSEFLDPSEE